MQKHTYTALLLLLRLRLYGSWLSGQRQLLDPSHIHMGFLLIHPYVSLKLLDLDYPRKVMTKSMTYTLPSSTFHLFLTHQQHTLVVLLGRVWEWSSLKSNRGSCREEQAAEIWIPQAYPCRDDNWIGLWLAYVRSMNYPCWSLLWIEGSSTLLPF